MFEYNVRLPDGAVRESYNPRAAQTHEEKIKERQRIKGENKKSEEHKNTFLSSNFVNLLHSTKSACVCGVVLVHCSHSLFILTQARQKRRNAGKKGLKRQKKKQQLLKL